MLSVFSNFFYVLVCLFIMVIFSAGVVFSKNPVYSITFLIGVFINTFVVYNLLGVEYVALLLIVVYVGAVSILFLFVIMFLNLRIMELYIQWTYFLYFSLFFILVFLFQYYLFNNNSLNFLDYFFVGFKLFPMVSTLFSQDIFKYIVHVITIAYFGTLGFNTYGHFIVIIGIILLVCMIGTIILIKSKNSFMKLININTWYTRALDVAKFLVSYD